jgi:phosphoglycolate phosphatase
MMMIAMASKKIEGILFDLDGTLLNTLEDLASAMNSVLMQHNYPIHPVDAYRQFVGDGVLMLVRRALKVFEGEDTLISNYAEEFITAYSACCNSRTTPYDGITVLLDELENKRLPLAVLSNKPHESTVEIVRHYFSGYHFIALLGEGIFPKKPDPEGALYISLVMGIGPEQCLYIGDTGTDMRTAKNAGMPSAGVLWGFRDEKELHENGAQWIARHPREILDIIDNY